ncbi:beta-1,3-galactosyltransferase 1-like [Mya arenaria]|uniref:beta-1,3-galactosyltransferase 1-like n=1 Tax=Mya arenaria TaxID=6604 RepID=UPI0022E8B634|nr:beta-1,3-galactosyltransferase 1-like [Mya arenaria]
MQITKRLDFNMMRKIVGFAIFVLCACAGVNVLFFSVADDVTRQRLYSGYAYGSRHFANGPSSSKTIGALNENVLQRITQRKLHDTQSINSSNPTASDERIYSFSVNPHRACARNETTPGGELWGLLTIVISNVNNFKRRNAIRNTWGSTEKDTNSKLLFLVGLDVESRSYSAVTNEAKLYGDIIQVELLDQYKDLTYKSIAMLQWMIDYCPNVKFYMKTDDDVYANIENIVGALDATKQRRKGFYCHVFKNAPAIRDINSKWYVSKTEYSGNVFPTYCAGPAYIFDASVIKDLYRSTLNSPFLSMEDVFITGLSAKPLNLFHQHDGRMDFNRREPTGCVFQKTLAAHQMTEADMFVIFSQLQSKEVDCDTNTNNYLTKFADS